MELGSIAVLGGGPGGLYAARLLKRRHPAARVVVHEQGRPGETFGFGVGLASRTQRNLRAADPETLEQIVEHGWLHDMSMSVGGERVRLGRGDLLAIGRATLLDVLLRHAVDVGVEVLFGSRVTEAELDADLVVAADGINSLTRSRYAEELGATVETDHGWYLWCGTEFALPSAVFAPVTTEAGTFVAHAYPYAPDRSTFLVETDEETWRRAGFDETAAATPSDASDEVALGYLADAFAVELEGHRLIGNRTRWTRFRTVRCRRWFTGRTVLLGDAAHTAHYSIGSGTKLAMEDAIVLDRVLAEAGSLPDALAAYDEERRPAVEHLQQTAEHSMRWWHAFPQRLEQPVEQLFLGYMTRAGKVSVDAFAGSAPDVVRRGLTAWAGAEPPASDLTSWVLAQPWTRGARSGPSRRVTDQPELRLHELAVGADPVVGARETLAAGCDGVLLTCADDAESVLTTLAAAERLRWQSPAVVAVRAAARWSDHLVAALVSGRVDLVDLDDALVAA